MGRFESRITNPSSAEDGVRCLHRAGYLSLGGRPQCHLGTYTPWELESRMHIKTNDAFGVTLDQVVTHFESYRPIDFISHFAGITLLTQVHFKALSDEETEVHWKLEFIGTFSRMAGFAIGPALEQGTEKFYKDLRPACEQQPPSRST